MEISDFTLRIILLFIPGLVCMLIIKQLIEQEETSLFDYVIQTLLCSFLAYSATTLLCESTEIIINSINKLFNNDYTVDFRVIFLDCLTNKDLEISFLEIIITSFISIPIAFFISWFLNKKHLHKIAKRLNCTNRFGDIDVWSYTFNSDNSFYVLIRDIERNLMYQGFATAFSKSHKNNELLLLNVSVFANDTAEHLYDIDMMYFSREESNLTIEFRGIIEDNKKEENKK